MGKIVHARMDEETDRLLTRLRRQTGLRDSEIVRRGIRALATVVVAGSEREIVGLGSFESGKPDLGSNAKHLRGFGRS
ncbi:MAG: hypothetical protein JXR96_20765 [Deltaproteobacteria bacterium]|nr:hypothetical protein [Deltaproteobacteria bacterium]